MSGRRDTLLAAFGASLAKEVRTITEGYFQRNYAHLDNVDPQSVVGQSWYRWIDLAEKSLVMEAVLLHLAGLKEFKDDVRLHRYADELAELADLERMHALPSREDVR